MSLFILTFILFSYPSLGAPPDSLPLVEQQLFNIFLNSEQYRALRKKVTAEWYLHENAFKKSEITLGSQLYRNKAKNLSLSDLNNIGIYENEDSLLSLSAQYTFRNSPTLSSLQLTASMDMHKYGYQTVNSAFEPDRYDSREIALTLSYDLAKGGGNDLTFLTSKVEKNAQARAYYESLNEMQQTYLSFLKQSLGLIVVNCQFQNLEKSLGAIEKTLEIAEVGSQVGTYSYKDLLNVRSLKNIVENRKLLTHVNYQTSLQDLTAFGPEAQEFLTTKMKSVRLCQQQLGEEASNPNLVPNLNEEQKAFSKTLSNKIFLHSIAESRTRLKSTQVNRRPSIRPYVKNSINKEHFYGIDETKHEIGVTMEWDVPYAYSFATTKSQIAVLNSLKLQKNVTRNTFHNKIKNLNSRNLFLLNLVDNVKRTVTINDEILRILATQRSIGKTDSLSLTNAFLNKNESLNQLYESNSEIIINNAEFFYELNWNKFLTENIQTTL